nr:hypothetical protein [Tanacetum cinerariifolium]
MADLPPYYVAENPDNEPVEDDKDKKEDPEEKPEEEEMEDEEMEDEEMVNNEKDEGNEEDDAELINPYKEADPHNRPPSTSDEETEFAPPVAQIADANRCNSQVYAPSPMWCDLKSVHKGVKRLSKEMHDRYRTKKKMARKFKQYELRMNGQEFNITALDSVVRENRSKNSKMMKMIEGLSREFTELKIQNRGAEEIMPLRRMNKAKAKIERLIDDAIAQDRATRGSTASAGGSGGNNTKQGGAPPVRECTYSSFIKCNPTTFKGVEGAVELCHWFEKTKSVFSISECAKRNKDSNIATYTQRSNELVLLCLEAVPSKKKKVEAYIRGLPEIIKGEMTSTRHVVLNEAVGMAHTLMEQKFVAKAERIAERNKRKWENTNQGNNNNNSKNQGNYRNNNRHNKNNNRRQSNARALTTTQNAGENQIGIAPKCNHCGRCANVQSIVVCYECGERGHKINACPKRANRHGGNVQGQAYVIRDAEHNQGPNVVTGTFLLNNHYATILFDSRADKSFVDIKFSHFIDIKPVKLNLSYEVELADGKVFSTNSVLRGCTLNLLEHLFDTDLMPIELGTFDVIVGMDLLIECDALIVCGKKEVHVLYKNKTLVVKSDSSVSQLKKEPAKKQLQDVLVICNFPEVFLDDLPRLPPPRQVEFKIKLILGVAPVACAPYRLAPSEPKELSDQLKELLEKRFIRLSSSP